MTGDPQEKSQEKSQERSQERSQEKSQEISLEILKILLKDRTSGKNIVWATDDYQDRGEQYRAECEITSDLITGENDHLIQSRAAKTQQNQLNRTKDKAEVFTPSWICNAQNNLIDHAWFGREGVFNTERNQTWQTNTDKILFPDSAGKTWKNYVDSTRMEITCGEAPYLVSRYDVVNAEPIPVEHRIGFLDRKMRVVGENTSSEEEWYRWVIRAYQSIYGFEYQGDSLLLARKNLLYTFTDYLEFKFHRQPARSELVEIATIISWNLWQMDGLTYSVPHSGRRPVLYCKIKDWRAARWKKKAIIEYRSLIRSEGTND